MAIDRRIPAVMATQHPDNAGPPTWERHGDGFVSVREETAELLWCFRELGATEFMWDWEGKYADEAVVDRLFTDHAQEFRRAPLGRDRFLTFRLPNVWREPGYSLARAFMVVLTSEDFAHDLGHHSPPLFEAILPMCERAEQLTYLQRTFTRLARCVTRTFNHVGRKHQDYLHLIPLVEDVHDQLAVGRLLERYLLLHRRLYGRKPAYLRPFLARSDPALASGMLANVLATKVALSQLERFSERTQVPTFPIIGAGSLPFRGGLAPGAVQPFVRQYAGVRTVTVQSAFRYDYPLAEARAGVQELGHLLPRTRALVLTLGEERLAAQVVGTAERHYQAAVAPLLRTLAPVFAAVPRRRERRLHIGLLGYRRQVGRYTVPRAIGFTAAFYSLGIPPEFIGTGRTLARLTSVERTMLDRAYPNLRADLVRAGRYLCRENLGRLARQSRAWTGVEADVAAAEAFLGVMFGPRTARERAHVAASRGALNSTGSVRSNLAARIIETGLLRRSLG